MGRSVAENERSSELGPACARRAAPVRNPQQIFYLTHQNAPDRLGNTGDSGSTFGVNVYNL